MELIVKGVDGGEVKAYACGKCGAMWSAKSGQNFARETAEMCCTPKVCECGAPVDEQYYTACKACRAKRDATSEANRLEKAEKIKYADYKGDMLYHDSFGNDGYCSTSDVYDELDQAEPEDRPKYAWACYEQHLSIDVEDVLEHALQDHFEDAHDSLDDIPGLQKAIDAWVEKQTMKTFFSDYKKVVLLDTVLAELAKDDPKKDGTDG